jgi:peptide deformylase
VAVKEILLLGNPRLYQVSEPVRPDELADLSSTVNDLHDTLLDFRRRYGHGRAIAAPQIGVMKRLIYWHSDPPIVLINPVLENLSPATFVLWDDCMSFPDLLVKVLRHRSCTVRFRDMNWLEISRDLNDDRSELIQHEYDHLDGILATQRAIDERSFALPTERNHLAD